METKNEYINYEAPSVEVITINVEQGFASTNIENLEQGEETEW